MQRIIFHIDVNSAYLSWEAAYMLQHGSDLDLREIPAIVGGDVKKRKGIVLAKSIPAKAYGITTGESVASAFRKCPLLVSVPPNYSRYMEASQAMVDLLSEYSPLIQRYSIDEVFFAYAGKPGEHLQQADLLREKIKNELGFTVNIGVGDNKLLAKVASDFQKPDRVHTLFQKEIPEKMWPLPVGDLFMVGSRTRRKLEGRGIFKIGDLARLDREYMHRWLKKPGLTLWEFANGIEETEVHTQSPPPKSVSNSTTIPFDVEDKGDAYRVLLAIAEMVGMRLRNLEMLGKVVAVSLKDFAFQHYAMERSLLSPTDDTNTIYHMAKKLFDEIWNEKPLRHFGIRVGRLSSNKIRQLSLFDCRLQKEENINRIVDRIRQKYGYTILQRSTFLHSGISPVIGGVLAEEDYPMMSSLL